MDNLLKKLLKNRLKQDFYLRETPLVAQELLGKLLVIAHDDTLLIGKIVETESYQSNDPASHSYRGKTERNSAMFGPVGRAYVYINYGIHHGFNIVARNIELSAGGVLVRALEPLLGIESMKKNRKQKFSDQNIHDLSNGPGKLTQALGITKEYNHLDLSRSSHIFITHDILTAQQHYYVGTSSRIGISKGKQYQWRFFIEDNPFVSYFKKNNS